MASYHGNTQSEPAKMEQIITEFFTKSLHIILESRCPYVSSRNYSGEQVLSSPSPSSSSSTSSFRPRDKWFNLALRDCPAALENIDFWRQSNLEPMIVDVVLLQKLSNWNLLNCSSAKRLVRDLSGKERHYSGLDNDEFGCEAKSEKIVERWLLQYESKKSSGNGGGSSGNKRSSCTSSGSLYKKSILLLRSLYATVRLLPAYKLFRDIISSAQICPFNLVHRISTFVEPFTRREEADMQKFVFTPVETSCGRLCLSVLYHSSVLELSSEPSTPLSPQFIPEYVGSPMAEPLKRYPSVPVFKSSPSSSPFGRRNSWSHDLYGISPPSVNPSPSPTYSESHAFISKQRLGLPPVGLPRNFHCETNFHLKNLSYDEYCPSPAFSQSPSPSPPTYVIGGHVSKILSRSESAPLSIPTSKLSSVPSLPNNQVVRRSLTMKATRPTLSKQDSRVGFYQTSSTVDKLLFLARDETGKMSSLKPSSNSSPSKSFSRSSSRLSFQDDYDDSEFSGPFVVDDDDMVDPRSRPGSFDQARHSSEPSDEISQYKRSQDAAVGALVHMLKKAPPLRQDNISVTTAAHRNSAVGVVEHSDPSPSIVSSKTIADALEELRGYRELKDVLLKQGKISHPG